MAEITASMVKELREMTGLGMMDCKKALAETDGDMRPPRIFSGSRAARKPARLREGSQRKD